MLGADAFITLDQVSNLLPRTFICHFWSFSDYLAIFLLDSRKKGSYLKMRQFTIKFDLIVTGQVFTLMDCINQACEAEVHVRCNRKVSFEPSENETPYEKKRFNPF